MIVRLGLPDYRPDMTVNAEVLLTAENVIPAADGSYRPIGGLSTFTDAVTGGAFRGGYSAISSDGTAFLLAGHSTGYDRLVAGAWTNVKTGLTVSGRWHFAQFGDYILMVNGGVTRELDFSGPTDTAVAGAPSGTSVTVVGDHVVIGQPDNDRNKVAWSAFGDHTGWTPGTDQAGEQVFYTGGPVQGVAGGEYGIVLQRNRLVRMSRTGDADVPFQFDEISANYGCSDGATIAQAGRTVFFHSDRGFMALDDGQALRPIGSEKVDRTFATMVGRDNLSRLFSAVDPENKLVMWAVPGTPGLVWIYNFELERWATGSIPLTGMMPGVTNSTTLEELGSANPDLDVMTVSLDDARWRGGAPQLYFFDTGNAMGTLTGPNLQARLKHGYAEIIQGQRARIRGMRPITDAISGLTITTNAKLRIGDGENMTASSPLRRTGTCPLRARGRFISNEIGIAAGTPWSYIRGLEIDCYAGGER